MESALIVIGIVIVAFGFVVATLKDLVVPVLTALLAVLLVIRLAIKQLLSNALKYAPPPTPVAVPTSLLGGPS